MTALRCCAEPGCPQLTGRTYCPDHLRARRRAADQRRPSAHQRGYNQGWRHTRARVLAARPCCEQPGCGAPATDVHHLDHQGPHGPRGHDPANLRALCHSCHSRITGHGRGEELVGRLEAAVRGVNV